jgi:hypothetical protein
LQIADDLEKQPSRRVVLITGEEIKEAMLGGIPALLKEGYPKSAAWAVSGFGVTGRELMGVLERARSLEAARLRRDAQ